MAARHYEAFLSYSHANEREGRWLHRSLERFRVPRSLVERSKGQLPKRIAPVFRDREELAAAADLPERIDAALEHSERLVVLCSPASARSMWVDKEIRRFKVLHGEERVFCMIVGGEPYADANAGEEECFPPSIRRRVGPDGELEDERAEPLAADARAGKDERRDALLKLVAGMLGVGFDELRQRDRVRRRRTRIALGTTVTLVLLAIGASLVNAVISGRRALEATYPAVVADLIQRAQDPWPRGGTLEEALAGFDAWIKDADAALVYVESRHQTEVDGRTSRGARLARMLDQAPELKLLRQVVPERRALVEASWSRWDEARADLARDRRFGGLEIAPQDGLLPLAAHPASGLWEFVLCGSGSPPTAAELARSSLPDDFGLVLVLLPGGAFAMGGDSFNSKPVHDVALEPFFLAKYECTNAQWEAIGGRPLGVHAGADFPAKVPWWDEIRVALAAQELMLPSEAQWEYGCRAGTTTAFCTGDDEGSVERVAWTFDSNNEDMWSGHPVGRKGANAFGLYDMHGNLAEWVADRYADSYEGAPTDGSPSADGGKGDWVVWRGGSFMVSPAECASFARAMSDTNQNEIPVTFRAARALVR